METSGLLGCSDMEVDIKNGYVKKYIIGDSGSYTEPHYIFLVKMRTDILDEPDPTKRYKPTGGSQFVKIRPNDTYQYPSMEEGKMWIWYMLSCPHSIPCPILGM